MFPAITILIELGAFDEDNNAFRRLIAMRILKNCYVAQAPEIERVKFKMSLLESPTPVEPGTLFGSVTHYTTKVPNSSELTRLYNILVGTIDSSALGPSKSPNSRATPAKRSPRRLVASSQERNKMPPNWPLFAKRGKSSSATWTTKP